MKKYPLLIQYIPKTALWGGTKLHARYQKVAPFEKISETWELSVREQDDCLIRNGEYEGMTLGTYLGDAHKPFPLLIKFIDANDKLSVQVHPDDAYAALDNDLGKTEMWYILEAEEGANLIYGLKEGATSEDFKAAVKAGKIEEVLNHQPVAAGETYFIPAGMVHGIGKGILVAEIQQSSDLTYRVYDYDRRDAAGNLRELHVEKAMDVTRPFTKEDVDAVRFAKGVQGLANCPYFFTDKKTAPFKGETKEYEILLFIAGSGEILFNGERIPVKAGDCCYLPDDMGAYEIKGETDFLFVKEN